MQKIFSSKELVVYGAGMTGKQLYAFLYNICDYKGQVVFCDTYKTGTVKKLDVPITSFDEIPQEAPIIIGVSDYVQKEKSDEIVALIKNHGIDMSRVVLYSDFIKLMYTQFGESPEWRNFGEQVYDFETNIVLVEHIAGFIGNNDRSIVDLGAGGMLLQRFIRPDVAYFPVDYIQRSEQTIVCDFNKEEFPNINGDVYVLCAMLYYINNPVQLLERCAEYAEKKIIVALHNTDLACEIELYGVMGLKSYLWFDKIEAVLKKHKFIPSHDITIIETARRFVVYEKSE